MTAASVMGRSLLAYTRRMRSLLLAIALMLALAACGGSNVDYSDVPELAAIDGDELMAQLTQSNEPVVVNIWASWILPGQPN